VVIVDQHAAHERLVYERLKRQRDETGVARQALLIPEIVTLGADADRLLEMAEDLEALGLVIEPFGPGTLAVRETPAILGPVNAEAILRDILDELDDAGTPPRCNPASMPCSAAWPATAPSARAAG
jgi:DNA mismatch repair protein MutL